MMHQLILVFIGSGIGGVLRYIIGTSLPISKKIAFPFQTLIVNILASLLLGVFLVLISKKTNLESSLRAFLIIGICGGFSTFSTFSYENVLLFQNGQYLYLMSNVLLSIFLCFLAVYLGYQLAN